MALIDPDATMTGLVDPNLIEPTELIPPSEQVPTRWSKVGQVPITPEKPTEVLPKKPTIKTPFPGPFREIEYPPALEPLVNPADWLKRQQLYEAKRGVIGGYTLQKGQIGSGALLTGALNPKNWANSDEWRKQTLMVSEDLKRQFPGQPPKEPWYREMTGGAAETLPYMADTAAKAIVAAKAVTLAGAPEAAPFAAGAVVIFNTAMLEGGGRYLDWVDEGMDPRVAAPASLAAGVAIGAIENSFIGYLFRRIPIAKQFLRKEILTEVTQNPGLRKALLNTLKEFGKVLAVQVGQENAQELTGDLVHNSATALNNVFVKNGISPEDYGMPKMTSLEEMWKNQLNTAWQSGLAMTPYAMLGLPSYLKAQTQYKQPMPEGWEEEIKVEEVKDKIAPEVAQPKDIKTYRVDATKEQKDLKTQEEKGKEEIHLDTIEGKKKALLKGVSKKKGFSKEVLDAIPDEMWEKAEVKDLYQTLATLTVAKEKADTSKALREKISKEEQTVQDYANFTPRLMELGEMVLKGEITVDQAANILRDEVSILTKGKVEKKVKVPEVKPAEIVPVIAPEPIVAPKPPIVEPVIEKPLAEVSEEDLVKEIVQQSNKLTVQVQEPKVIFQQVLPQGMSLEQLQEWATKRFPGSVAELLPQEPGQTTKFIVREAIPEERTVYLEKEKRERKPKSEIAAELDIEDYRDILDEYLSFQDTQKILKDPTQRKQFILHLSNVMSDDKVSIPLSVVDEWVDEWNEEHEGEKFEKTSNKLQKLLMDADIIEGTIKRLSEDDLARVVQEKLNRNAKINEALKQAAEEGRVKKGNPDTDEARNQVYSVKFTKKEAGEQSLIPLWYDIEDAKKAASGPRGTGIIVAYHLNDIEQWTNSFRAMYAPEVDWRKDTTDYNLPHPDMTLRGYNFPYYEVGLVEEQYSAEHFTKQLTNWLNREIRRAKRGVRQAIMKEAGMEVEEEITPDRGLTIRILPGPDMNMRYVENEQSFDDLVEKSKRIEEYRKAQREFEEAGYREGYRVSKEEQRMVYESNIKSLAFNYRNTPGVTVGEILTEAYKGIPVAEQKRGVTKWGFEEREYRPELKTWISPEAITIPGKGALKKADFSLQATLDYWKKQGVLKENIELNSSISKWSFKITENPLGYDEGFQKPKQIVPQLTFQELETKLNNGQQVSLLEIKQLLMDYWTKYPVVELKHLPQGVEGYAVILKNLGGKNREGRILRRAIFDIATSNPLQHIAVRYNNIIETTSGAIDAYIKAYSELKNTQLVDNLTLDIVNGLFEPVKKAIREAEIEKDELKAQGIKEYNWDKAVYYWQEKIQEMENLEVQAEGMTEINEAIRAVGYRKTKEVGEFYERGIQKGKKGYVEINGKKILNFWYSPEGELRGYPAKGVAGEINKLHSYIDELNRRIELGRQLMSAINSIFIPMEQGTLDEKVLQWFAERGKSVWEDRAADPGGTYDYYSGIPYPRDFSLLKAVKDFLLPNVYNNISEYTQKGLDETVEDFKKLRNPNAYNVIDRNHRINIQKARIAMVELEKRAKEIAEGEKYLRQEGLLDDIKERDNWVAMSAVYNIDPAKPYRISYTDLAKENPEIKKAWDSLNPLVQRWLLDLGKSYNMAADLTASVGAVDAEALAEARKENGYAPTIYMNKKGEIENINYSQMSQKGYAKRRKLANPLDRIKGAESVGSSVVYSQSQLLSHYFKTTFDMLFKNSIANGLSEAQTEDGTQLLIWVSEKVRGKGEARKKVRHFKWIDAGPGEAKIVNMGRVDFNEMKESYEKSNVKSFNKNINGEYSQAWIWVPPNERNLIEKRPNMPGKTTINKYLEDIYQKPVSWFREHPKSSMVISALKSTYLFDIRPMIQNTWWSEFWNLFLTSPRHPIRAGKDIVTMARTMLTHGIGLDELDSQMMYDAYKDGTNLDLDSTVNRYQQEMLEQVPNDSSLRKLFDMLFVSKGGLRNVLGRANQAAVIIGQRYRKDTLFMDAQDALLKQIKKERGIVLKELPDNIKKDLWDAAGRQAASEINDAAGFPEDALYFKRSVRDFLQKFMATTTTQAAIMRQFTGMLPTELQQLPGFGKIGTPGGELLSHRGWTTWEKTKAQNFYARQILGAGLVWFLTTNLLNLYLSRLAGYRRSRIPPEKPEDYDWLQRVKDFIFPETGYYAFERPDPDDWGDITLGKDPATGKEILLSTGMFGKDIKDLILFTQIIPELIQLKPPRYIFNKMGFGIKPIAEALTGFEITGWGMQPIVEDRNAPGSYKWKKLLFRKLLGLPLIGPLMPREFRATYGYQPRYDWENTLDMLSLVRTKRLQVYGPEAEKERGIMQQWKGKDIEKMEKSDRLMTLYWMDAFESNFEQKELQKFFNEAIDRWSIEIGETKIPDEATINRELPLWILKHLEPNVSFFRGMSQQAKINYLQDLIKRK